MTRKNLIGANEIAEVLGIQCQTVYLWVRQKRIPFYRVGRLVKFDEAEVLAKFKADIDDAEDQQSNNGTLSVQTRSPVSQTIHNLKQQTDRSASSIRIGIFADNRTKRALHGHAGDGKVALLLVRGCTAKKGA